MYMNVYRISYNFKSCIQNLNLHVKPQDLDNSIRSLIIRTLGPFLISGEHHIKNSYCILFFWGGKKKIKHLWSTQI